MLFDRTGKKVITGADDFLVKVRYSTATRALAPAGGSASYVHVAKLIVALDIMYVQVERHFLQHWH
jgi:hypothetical protein